MHTKLALLAQTNYLYVDGFSGYSNCRTGTKRKFYVGGVSGMEVESEAKLWESLVASPASVEALRHGPMSTNLYRQLLVRRCDLFQSVGAEGVAAMEAKVKEEMNFIALTCLAALRATSKGKLTFANKMIERVIPLHLKKPVSYEDHHDFDLGQPEGDFHLRLLPSPLEESAWFVQLVIPGHTLQSLQAKAPRLQAVYDALAANGIKVSNWLDGTWSAL